MDDNDPKPDNPLSPYYPSEVPDIPGDGRTWFAILLTLILIFGTFYWAVSIFI
ncbi:hypothetical protein [Halorubrum trueperi]|uniref:Uncharacterized protein n=1 Tax=Halorubrum trueperi TaxID=2004704 RepID=A0ABD5UHX0_9EURY